MFFNAFLFSIVTSSQIVLGLFLLYLLPVLLSFHTYPTMASFCPLPLNHVKSLTLPIHSISAFVSKPLDEVKIQVDAADVSLASYKTNSLNSDSKCPDLVSLANDSTNAQNIDIENENYVLFRTKSAKINPGLEKQLSRLSQKDHQNSNAQPRVTEVSTDVAAGRYFDALQGPELEVLKESEDALLPKNQQWPFLLRFPISCFGVSLGLSSQAILWKQLALNSASRFLHVPIFINLVLWSIAILAFLLISCTYVLKCIFYLEAVRREYWHPVRVNYFFAPSISAMFLILGMPPIIISSVHSAAWCIVMVPVFILELKIYGQWLSGGDRRLSMVANPSTHLSVAGNFVGALLAATVAWKEVAIFFWAVGLAHYLVLFVTLYQRLPTNEALPKDLHPVFFLFIAAPSAASLAWEKITGSFGFVCRIIYFTAFFLYCSLVVRINFFRGIRFSFAWWAYTFPMTALSLATLRYAHQVDHPVTQAAAVALSLISAATVTLLFVSTLMHLLLWGTLFPNDLAIAITQKRRRSRRAKRTLNKASKASGHCGAEHEGPKKRFFRCFNGKVGLPLF